MVEMTTLADGRTMIVAYIDHQLNSQSILDAVGDMIREAKTLVAERYWKEHESEIMAKMDMKGLANLIALHASEALRKK